MRFECEIQARIRDINLGGHVDSVEALRIIDEGRALFFGLRPTPGMPPMPGVLSAAPMGVGPLVGSHHTEYRSEMRYAGHQPFRLTIWLGHLGRSSFTVQTELRFATASPGDAPAVIGETAVILLDRNTDAPWEITGDVRQTLEEYVEAPLPLRPRPGVG